MNDEEIEVFLSKKFDDDNKIPDIIEKKINNTLNKIKSDKKSKIDILKPILTGIAAMFIITVTSLAAYVAIGGERAYSNILNFFGIYKYDQYSQDVNQIQEKYGVKLTLTDMACDDSIIILGLDLESEKDLGEVLDVEDDSWYEVSVAKRDGEHYNKYLDEMVEDNIWIGVTKMSSKTVKISPNKYRLYTILLLDDVSLYDSELKFQYYTTKHLIDDQFGWDFYVHIPQKSNIDELVPYPEKHIAFEDVDMTVDNIVKNKFSTVISLTLIQDGNTYHKTNARVDNLGINVTDEKGNILEVIAQIRDMEYDSESKKVTKKIKIIMETPDCNFKIVPYIKQDVDDGNNLGNTLTNVQTIKPTYTQEKDIFEKYWSLVLDAFNSDLDPFEKMEKVYDLKSRNYNHIHASSDIGDAIWWGLVDRYTTSSTLNNKYNVNNLYDDKYKTAWAEGKEGLGIGEYIEIKSQMCIFERVYVGYEDPTVPLEIIADLMKNLGFPTHDGKEAVQYISGLYIVNGYAENSKLWQENARVKKLKVYSDNKEIAILELEDTDRAQLFDIPKITKAIDKPFNLKFEIIEVYPGTKYDDTCLSEFVLNVGTNISMGR